MNWHITVKNKAGFITTAGYTHKSQEQINSICDGLTKQGLKIVKVVKR